MHCCHIFTVRIVHRVKGLSTENRMMEPFTKSHPHGMCGWNGYRQQKQGQEETPVDGRSYIDAVRAYADIVYRTALSYTKAPQDAEDVTQTVFMKLLETGDSFADEEHLRRWLIRVTVNECKNLWKSFWKRRVGLAEKTEPEEQEAYDYTGYTKRGARKGMPPENPEFDALSQSELYEAVMALPKDYRVIVHLFYYEDYRTGEIAELLHIREQTVRTRLVRARQKLRQRLEEAWHDEE